MTSVYSIYIGLASLLLSVTGLGKWATNSIPKPVRSGFKWGTAVAVLCSAVPNGFLIKGNSSLSRILAEDESASQLREYLALLKETFPTARGAG